MYLFREFSDSVNKYIKSLVTSLLVCITRPEAAIVDDTFQLLPFNGIAHSIRFFREDVNSKYAKFDCRYVAEARRQNLLKI